MTTLFLLAYGLFALIYAVLVWLVADELPVVLRVLLAVAFGIGWPMTGMLAVMGDLE